MTHRRLRPLLPASPRSLASWVFVSLAAASGAFAADPCDSNADCPAGYQCELSAPTIGCPSPPPDCQGDACNVDCRDGEPGSGVCVEIPASCTSDADCGEGFLCIAAPIACAAPDCPAGPEGDECRELASCDDAQSEGYCHEDFRPASCDTDADCGEGDVCERFVYEECTGTVSPCESDPAGNVMCDDPPLGPDEECTIVEDAFCIPRYAASCDVDDDCGPGFTCEALEACSCSGSSGAMEGGEGDSEGTDANDGAEDGCVCEPTDERYCALQDLPCESDEECPAGLVCEFVSLDATSCTADSEGNAQCDDVPELTQYGQCVPPGYGADTTDGPVEPGIPGGDPNGGTSGGNLREDGNEVPADADGDTDGDGGADGDTDTDGNAGGFSLGCASTSAEPSLLGLALLALGLRRRRQRS